MEDVVTVMNKLQDVFASIGTRGDLSVQDIELPQIVVIGMQSSGKSSVLESLIGESLLPRGEGAVTRCPIIIQLVHHQKGSGKKGSPKKWCEFLHREGKIYDNFNDVEKELRSQMDKIAGKNSGIVKQPIRLTIKSPDVVNLTVVDLPGIVKIPSGDQPKDIENQITTMIREYATNPNSIILAISPANNDLPTSESLALAKEVDPKGDRTLSVITKLDLMDQGSDYARKMLSGNIIPVKLGLIGVVNRSQQENLNNKTIKKALEDEVEFLKKNYPELAKRNGTEFLGKKLSGILRRHINKCLPDLERRLFDMRETTQAELDALELIDSGRDKSQTVLEVIHNFCEAYKAEIFGKSRDMDTERLYTKSKMAAIFGETFAKDMQNINPLKDITDEQISNAISNSRSLESGQFFPEDAFQHLVRQDIRRMEGPAIQCAELIDGAMKEAVQNSLCSAQVDKFISVFPALRDAIVDITQAMHRERMTIAKEKIKDHIDILATFVKTFDNEFIKNQAEVIQSLDLGQPGRGKVIGNASRHSTPDSGVLDDEDDFLNWKPEPEPPGNAYFSQRIGVKTAKPSENDKNKAVRKMVDQYFKLQQKGLQDYVPRVLAHAVIYDTEKKIQTELTHQLHNASRAEELIQVPENLRLQRENIEANLQKLEDAIKCIRECRSSA